MLKTSTLLFVLFLLPFSSNAQLKVIGSAGLNYGDVFIPTRSETEKMENEELMPILNFNGGFYVEYPNEKINLTTGFFFSKRGTKTGENSFYGNSHPFERKEGTLSFYFWEIPLLIRSNLIFDKFEIGGGIVNSFLADADLNIAGNINNNYQIDMKVLLRWNMSEKFTTEIGYLYGGLNHLDDQFYFGHSVLNLNLNYHFLSWDFKAKK